MKERYINKLLTIVTLFLYLSACIAPLVFVDKQVLEIHRNKQALWIWISGITVVIFTVFSKYIWARCRNVISWELLFTITALLPLVIFQLKHITGIEQNAFLAMINIIAIMTVNKHKCNKKVVSIIGNALLSVCYLFGNAKVCFYWDRNYSIFSTTLLCVAGCASFYLLSRDWKGLEEKLGLYKE